MLVILNSHVHGMLRGMTKKKKKKKKYLIISSVAISPIILNFIIIIIIIYYMSMKFIKREMELNLIDVMDESVYFHVRRISNVIHHVATEEQH